MLSCSNDFSSQIDEYALFKAYLNNAIQQTRCTSGQLNVKVTELGSIKFESNLSASFSDRLNPVIFCIDHNGLTIQKFDHSLDGAIEPNNKQSSENNASPKIFGTLILIGNLTPEAIDIDLLNSGWSDCIKALSATSPRIKTAPLPYGDVPLVKLDEALNTIKKHDPITRLHQINVAKLSRWIGEEVGLEEHRLETLWVSSLLHDIGKLSIPRHILNKPGHLDPSEYDVIKHHVDLSQPFLEELNAHWKVKEIVSQHHEREDGSGYPKGLNSSQMYIEAKIIAVADVFDAMCARRPYRSPCRINEVITHLDESKGKLFDELVVNSLIKLVETRNDIIDLYKQ